MGIRTVVIPVDDNERGILEQLENVTFKSEQEARDSIKAVDMHLYTLSDFVDACKCEELSLETNWIGYIEIEEVPSAT